MLPKTIVSYTETLCKSGLDRSVHRRDLITQNVFREMKDPKHSLHYLLPPVVWVSGPMCVIIVE